MEERLREAGVEVFLKYPQAQPPFKDDLAFLIHYLQKQAIYGPQGEAREKVIASPLMVIVSVVPSDRKTVI